MVSGAMEHRNIWSKTLLVDHFKKPQYARVNLSRKSYYYTQLRIFLATKAWQKQLKSEYITFQDNAHFITIKFLRHFTLKSSLMFYV